MKKKEPIFFLKDIDNSLNKIFKYTEKFSYDEFVNSDITKDAVEKIYQLGRKIVELRKKQHFTQENFSEMIDISREHLAKIETAKRSVSLDLLILIAEKLNVKVKDLIEF